ncbi:MAG: UDP-glucose/iron transport system permease protein [Microbacteriaceae bacterium]|jgi:putative ABC transport system permease protein|nr:UDP-glucose/iron transport system permease protein [Microbacteriaceae bacterium]MDQ1578210.1 UDP-glucose/iron transport system permease protein [Microbacteriaceae bacterium]
MTGLAAFVPTLLGVGLLMALTVAVLWFSRAPHRFAPALAILRGAIQLAVISFILGGVITDPVWVTLALLVMFTVASVTAARRIGWTWNHFALVSSAMGIGIAITLAIIFATGAIAFSPRYALAVGGIVIGSTMAIATVAGRRFMESVGEQWDQVEGWLALGGTPRESTLELARGAIYSALIPPTDQTKTTGLVTLPGAFVGAIFGGVSPIEAGRFQIVVLAAIMSAGAITAVIVIRILAPVKVRPSVLR